MRKLKFIILFVLGAVFFALPLVTHACPGCAEAANESLARGFNNSILFLMAMPFTIVGGVALCLVVMHRRHQLAMKTNANVSPITSEKEEERT